MEQGFQKRTPFALMSCLYASTIFGRQFHHLVGQTIKSDEVICYKFFILSRILSEFILSDAKAGRRLDNAARELLKD